MKSSSSSSELCSSSGSCISSSSMVATQKAAALARTRGEEQLFYLVITPRYGEQSVLAFRAVREMVAELTRWLDRKQAGTFEGDILVFRGTMIEYSKPIMNYRINVPEVGELSVTDAGSGKYVIPIPAAK